MANDTNVQMNLEVKGTSSLTDAANALSKVNNNLRDMASSLNAAIRGLDRLEKNLSGVRTNSGTASKGIDAATKSLKEYTRVAATVKGQSVQLVPSSTSPRERDSKGRFVSPKIAEVSDRAADRALAYNQAQQQQRALANLQPFMDKQIKNLQLLNRAQTTAAFGGEVFTQQLTKQQHVTQSLSTGNLPRLRYALFDVSNALAIGGAALLAFSVISLKTAITFQRNFADVQRTTGVTGSAVETLRDQFMDLYQSLPVSFQNLTKIGELGGQLDIASSDLAAFTSLVTKFSATTDVSVEAAATAFGRLSKLLKVPSAEFENLGSSILKVGVNSVATESQIISISSQIASIGHLAGLSADEVVGFSAELASVGTQPELARGTVTRLFGNIQRAVSTGGDALEAFGRISGVSGAEFASAFKADAMGTIQKFLIGVGNAGTDAAAALNQVGITSVRDVPTLLKLAQDTDGLAKALKDSADGYKEATELSSQYNIITSTVAEKLHILGNNFQALVANVGSSGTALGGFIDLLIGLVKTLNQLVANPIVGTITTWGVVFVTIAGVIALAGAGLLRLVASTLAARTAIDIASGGTGRFSYAIAALTGSMNLNTLAARTNATAIGAVGAESVASSVAVEASAGRMATAFKGIGAALFGLPGLIAAVAVAADGLAIGGLQTINLGIQEAFGNISSVDQWIAQIKSGTIDVNKLGHEIQATSGWWNEFMVNIDVTKSGLGILADDVKRFDEALAAADPIVAADAIAQLGLSTEEVANKFPLYTAALEAAGGADGIAALRAQEHTDALQTQLDSIADTVEAYTSLEQATIDQESSLYNLGSALQDSKGSFSQFTEEGRAATSSLLDIISAMTAAASSPQEAANNLQGLYNAIISQVPAAAGSLLFLRNAIASLGGATAPATIDITSFLAGLNKIGGSGGGGAGGAAKKVRTLVDYANDLRDVFSRAFEIRFDSQSNLDKITSSWQDLNDELAEYQRKVLELTADKAITEYFLSVANAYGDTLRAGKLTSDLADINADLADAQDGVNKTLVGNSKAAVKNRKTVTDLVKEYQDYIQSLAASGASQSTLQTAVANGKADFLAQAQALGFSNAELQKYVAGFDDMAIAINNVPRNVTVTANTNPAIQALNEFVAKASAAGSAAGSGFSAGLQAGLAKAGRGMALQAEITKQQAELFRYLQTGNISGARYLGQYIQQLSAKLASGKYASGGHISGSGTSTSDSIPIMASDGEFMIRNKAVSALGVPFLNYLNKYGSLPGFAAGGPVGSASPSIANGLMVELSPTDRRIIAESGYKVITMDGRVLADTTNEVNSTYAKRGQ